MSDKVRREVELAGCTSVERVLLDAFPILSGGRQLPEFRSGVDERMYFGVAGAYRTSELDGVEVITPDMHGDKDTTWYRLLVRDEITIDVAEPYVAPSSYVFTIAASAETIETVTDMLIGIAIARGFTLVARRA